MENKQKKETKLFGKVYNYDGRTGYVITTDDKYLIIPSSTSNTLSNNDIVSFYPDTFKFDNDFTKIARDIKLEKNNNKSLKKN